MLGGQVRQAVGNVRRKLNRNVGQIEMNREVDAQKLVQKNLWSHRYLIWSSPHLDLS